MARHRRQPDRGSASPASARRDRAGRRRPRTGSAPPGSWPAAARTADRRSPAVQRARQVHERGRGRVAGRQAPREDRAAPPPERAAAAATAPRSGVTRPGACTPARRRRPGSHGAGSAATSGSRNAMFRCTGPRRGHRHAAAARRPTSRACAGGVGRQRKQARACAANRPALLGGLVRAAIEQLGRPVGAQQQQRLFILAGLDRGRQPVRRGRAGGGDQRRRAPGRGPGRARRRRPSARRR
jgi:hypothetical protein